MKPKRGLVIAVVVAVGGIAGGGAVWATHNDDSDARAAAPITTSTTANASKTTSTSTAVDTPVVCTVAGVEIMAANTMDAHHLVVHDGTDGAAPTAADCAGAQAFYDAVDAGSERYADVNAALADGYRQNPDSVEDRLAIDHYAHHGFDSAVVDPEQPETLVYDNSGDTPKLIGVMFSERLEANLAQPGGPYTVWHDHTETCDPTAMPCPTDSDAAPKMMHVWFFPGVAEPFGHSYRMARGAT